MQPRRGQLEKEREHSASRKRSTNRGSSNCRGQDPGAARLHSAAGWHAQQRVSQLKDPKASTRAEDSASGAVWQRDVSWPPWPAAAAGEDTQRAGNRAEERAHRQDGGRREAQAQPEPGGRGQACRRSCRPAAGTQAGRVRTISSWRARSRALTHSSLPQGQHQGAGDNAQPG